MIRFAVITVALLVADRAAGHFVFVVPEKDGQTSRIIMSETLAVDEALDVSMLKNARYTLRGADGKDQLLEPRPLDKKHLLVTTPGSDPRLVHGTVDLGVMTRGAEPHWLRYYPKTIIGDVLGARLQVVASAPVQLVPVALPGEPAVRLSLLVSGRPQPESEVTIVYPNGEAREVTTDRHGLTALLTEPGRYAVWARYWEERAGAHDGQPYTQIRHYATLVFDAPRIHGSTVPADSDLSPSANVRHYGDLPLATSSFGAVAAGGWLYVYGGHIARTHVYHTESASGSFHRLDLSNGEEWQTLPAGPRLQGMNLAARDGVIYRVGGMQSLNREGEEADNRSIVQAARFDPATMSWADLAPLPQARSSHDVAFVGNRLYVLGGWEMRAAGKPRWIGYMDMLNVEHPNPQWVRIPQPFRRRALIAAVLDGRIYAIGGFDAYSKPSLDVDVFDPRTASWHKGPSLPGPVRNGFAPAACVLDGMLYASVGDGGLYRLDPRAGTWESVAHTTPRIVHRAVPFGSTLLLLGGAARNDNLAMIESVALQHPSIADSATIEPPARSAAGVTSRVPAPTGATTPTARTAVVTDQRFCPIMTGEEIDEGSPTVQYRGHTIALCCSVCVRRWERDPDGYAAASLKHLPQLAGETIPPRALRQVYCPVFRDRVISNRDTSVEYDGRTVYLFNKAALRRWNADPAKYADPRFLPQLAAAQ